MAIVKNPVSISFSGSEKTGVKIRGDFTGSLDPDIRWQQIVEHKGILIRRNAAGGIEMHHLHTCMDAGIRSGRTGDGDRMGAGGRERFLQNLLDSETVDLALPASIGGTVIFH